MSTLPEEMLAMINAHLGGYNRAMGVRVARATLDEVVVEMPVGDQHKQPYGLVHGGVLSSLVETACSIGAAINVLDQGRSTVGLENTTSFLKAVRAGTLTCTARPLSRGRRSHVWEARVTDDQQQLVAKGSVRMIVLAPGAEAAGEKVALKGEPDV